MHGQGTFVDPRLTDPVQFPIAAREGFAHVRHDPDLVTSKLPALHLYQLSLPIPHARVRNAASVRRGRALFDGKGRCAACHRVAGQGPRVAPDLTDVGANRSAASLLRSLTDPASQMMPINRPVRAVLRDGTVINGRRLNEDTYSVQIIDDKERLQSLLKSDLRELTVSTTSPMPSFKGKLSDDEIADVVAFLLSLKGQQS
jgi:putative heme-binding domain-containing protein